MFKKLLEKLVEHYHFENSEAVLAFVNTKIIKELNHRFLKKNTPTDVLSFPLREKSADGKFYLGDIIISVHQAFKQSLFQNHSLERELELLVIHGFLHLLGFDHSAGIEEEEMKMKNLFLEG